MRSVLRSRVNQALALCIQDVGLSLNRQRYQMTTMPWLSTFCKPPRHATITNTTTSSSQLPNRTDFRSPSLSACKGDTRIGQFRSQIRSCYSSGGINATPELTKSQPLTEQSMYSAIVKVRCHRSRPDFFHPWSNKAVGEVSGSGFLISGYGDGAILTNAHVVADGAYVTVKRHGSSVEQRAEVVATAHDCDLALLRVPGGPEALGGGLRPLSLHDGVPMLQERVTVMGFPTGGANLSITQGIVSRIGMTRYAHSGAHLLAVQIDAAINPGNSGGPALQGNEVVGVAFQNLRRGDNIGYIVPIPIVLHFLDAVENGMRHLGFCSLGIGYQPIENPQLRRALKLGAGMTGVLVTSVKKTGSSFGVLEKGDVLLSFDDVKIANDGSIPFRQHERLPVSHLISLVGTNAKVPLKLWRDGQVIHETVELSPEEHFVAPYTYDSPPSYYIFAGLVFIDLQKPFLQEWGDGEDWEEKCPQHLYHISTNEEASEEGEHAVVISHVLADEVNFGYSAMVNIRVRTINGVRVKNLRHVVEILTGMTEGWVKIEGDQHQVIIVDHIEAMNAEARILKLHRVPAAMSSDLM